MAPRTRAINSSRDLAWVWHPGNAGTEATKYPSASRSTTTSNWRVTGTSAGNSTQWGDGLETRARRAFPRNYPPRFLEIRVDRFALLLLDELDQLAHVERDDLGKAERAVTGTSADRAADRSGLEGGQPGCCSRTPDREHAAVRGIMVNVFANPFSRDHSDDTEWVAPLRARPTFKRHNEFRGTQNGDSEREDSAEKKGFNET